MKRDKIKDACGSHQPEMKMNNLSMRQGKTKEAGALGEHNAFQITYTVKQGLPCDM